jgi:primosomal protein N' (replication factor Y)
VDEEQLALVATPRRARKPKSASVASELPVARVVLDVPLPHLDRPFDYLVPESIADDAQPGVRVAVRFAGTDHQGFIIERVATSDHTGKLAQLRRLVSPERVLAPQIAQLARAVADRYAGTAADVLRLAIPPRHARAEAAESVPATPRVELPQLGGWSEQADGAALLVALSGDGAPRAVWNPGPGADWPDMLARLVLATVHGERGTLVVLPDVRDVARLDAALGALYGGDAAHVVLTADLGPEERYRRWLAVRRGAVRAVIGTRSAMFAPVRDLGLVAIWDDGDDLHAEPRAPYPHAREVLLLRAHHERAAAVVCGFARTAEAEALVSSGWARPVTPSRDAVRATAPRVHVSGDDYETARDAGARSARLPSLAWRTAREALQRGPVLVQVPRAGYVPTVACEKCRRTARCSACHGPIAVDGPTGGPRCSWCGTTAWVCADCDGTVVRAASVGAGRTAEELGRAFPGVAVRVSRGDAVLGEIEPRPALVVATPGAEPLVPGGYAAALVLDTRSQLARADLRAEEEALRRWFAAATLVRPADAGGQVVIVGEASARPVQALVRWDPAGFANRELATRTELHFPPVARVAELTGADDDVSAILELAELPPGADVLGPVPIDGPDADGKVRTIVRVPRSSGGQLAATLKAAQGVRSAKRSGDAVRVRIDPVELG